MSKRNPTQIVATKPVPAAKKPAGTNGSNGDGKTKTLVIEIDRDALTFGDVEMALTFQDGKIPMTELLPFLNRVVKGGVKNIPLTAAPLIMDALTAAFEDLGDTKN